MNQKLPSQSSQIIFLTFLWVRTIFLAMAKYTPLQSALWHRLLFFSPRWPSITLAFRNVGELKLLSWRSAFSLTKGRPLPALSINLHLWQQPWDRFANNRQTALFNYAHSLGHFRICIRHRTDANHEPRSNAWCFVLRDHECVEILGFWWIASCRCVLRWVKMNERVMRDISRTWCIWQWISWDYSRCCGDANLSNFLFTDAMYIWIM